MDCHTAAHPVGGANAVASAHKRPGVHRSGGCCRCTPRDRAAARAFGNSSWMALWRLRSCAGCAADFWQRREQVAVRTANHPLLMMLVLWTVWLGLVEQRSGWARWAEERAQRGLLEVARLCLCKWRESFCLMPRWRGSPSISLPQCLVVALTGWRGFVRGRRGWTLTSGNECRSSMGHAASEGRTGSSGPRASSFPAGGFRERTDPPAVRRRPGLNVPLPKRPPALVAPPGLCLPAGGRGPGGLAAKGKIADFAVEHAVGKENMPQLGPAAQRSPALAEEPADRDCQVARRSLLQAPDPAPEEAGERPGPPRGPAPRAPPGPPPKTGRPGRRLAASPRGTGAVPPCRFSGGSPPLSAWACAPGHSEHWRDALSGSASQLPGRVSSCREGGHSLTRHSDPAAAMGREAEETHGQLCRCTRPPSCYTLDVAGGADSSGSARSSSVVRRAEGAAPGDVPELESPRCPSRCFWAPPLCPPALGVACDGFGFDPSGISKPGAWPSLVNIPGAAEQLAHDGCRGGLTPPLTPSAGGDGVSISAAARRAFSAGPLLTRCAGGGRAGPGTGAGVGSPRPRHSAAPQHGLR